MNSLRFLHMVSVPRHSMPVLFPEKYDVEVDTPSLMYRHFPDYRCVDRHHEQDSTTIDALEVQKSVGYNLVKAERQYDVN